MSKKHPTWQDDVRNHNLPRDINAIDKLKCELRHGMRVGWYGKSDVDFSNEFLDGEDNPAETLPFRGLVVALNDGPDPTRPLEYDECIVVMDEYPNEKEPRSAIWIAMGRLLDNDDLVEVVEVVEVRAAIKKAGA